MNNEQKMTENVLIRKILYVLYLHSSNQIIRFLSNVFSDL